MTFQTSEPHIIYPPAYYSVRWMDNHNNPHETIFSTEVEAMKFIKNHFIIPSDIHVYLAMPAHDQVFLFRKNQLETIE